MTKLTSTAMASLALLASMAAHAQAAKTYIVQLREEPAASYQGTTTGYAATQAAPGTQFDARSSAARSYSAYLRGKQSAVLSSVSAAGAITQYDTVFNGFTARLTPDQAAVLSMNTNVAAVAEDQLLSPSTISTPVFLGLTAQGGIWSQTDANGAAIKGENMILGDVDLGIWPESPSYYDRVDDNGNPVASGGTLAYGPAPATWQGTCVAGDAFVPAQACNNKLIGARYYNTNLLSQGVSLDWTAFNSPRDDLGGATGLGGHGDHTASTAAGNDKVPAIVNGVTMGLASGMAPRARIAAYKVCFTYVTTAGNKNSCSSADSMAAIDQAVKDGVNAINFSISGATGSTNDMVEQAFYRATLAGVFVAAAAGNSGPANTVNHPSPWLTTVAAATHDRILEGDVNLGNGAKYTGASLNVSALSAAPLIRAEDAALGGSGDAKLCFTQSDLTLTPVANEVTLDPAKVAGKVVICTRGTNPRVNKSLAVQQAGGVGMILVDNGAGLVSEVHSVPTVHVTAADGAAIKSYAAGGGSPTASETAFYFGHQPAPTIAAFSGRGPNMADANILKPDLAAPGVGVIASVTPGYSQAQRNALAAGTLAGTPAWASYDGTSMATPHVTGISLLLKQAHPTWSPSAIKSALMTTAFDTLDDGLAGMQNGKLPWSQGAGFISPNKAIDPGLVYDMGKADYVKYQCLTQKSLVAAADCSTYGTLDQTYNLNLPSITIGSMLGTTTVKRTVRNVGSSAAVYTAAAAVNGMTTTVTPSTLSLAPGQSASFTMTIAPAANTPKFTWEYGSLTWSDGAGHNVRSPIQVALGQSISAPSDINANTVSGSRLFTISTGFAGHASANKGLRDVTMGPATTLAPNKNVDAAAVCKATGPTANVAVYTFAVPAGAIVARFALRQADVSGATDDNDLAVVLPNGAVAASEGGTSHETVELLNPAAGNYKVCVASYAAASGSSTHQLSSWIVSPGDTAGGAFNVAMPATVYPGGTSTVGVVWSGLATGHRYLGGIQYLDASATVATATALAIDTTPGTPLDMPTPIATDKASVTRK